MLLLAAVMLLFAFPLFYKFNGWVEKAARIAFTLVLFSVSFVVCAALRFEFFGKETEFFMSSLLPAAIITMIIMYLVDSRIEGKTDASGQPPALVDVCRRLFFEFFLNFRSRHFFIEVFGSTMLLFIAAAQLSKNFIVSPDWRYYGAWMTLVAGPCLAAAFVWLSRVKKSSRIIAFVVWTLILTFFTWKAIVPGIGAAVTSFSGVDGDAVVRMHKREQGSQKLELGEDKAVIYIRFAEALRLPLEGEITVSGRKSWFGFAAAKVVMPPSKRSE